MTDKQIMRLNLKILPRSDWKKWQQMKADRHKSISANNQFISLTRRMTYYALKTGALERKPCQVCGEERSEGHHEDYENPFDLMFLCRKHHAQLHGDRMKAETAERRRLIAIENERIDKEKRKAKAVK